MTASGRLAVVFPLPLGLEHVGKDPFLIPEGLRRRGFDVELHCPRANGDDWPLPVVEAGPGGLAAPAHWGDRGLDGAIVFSFLRYSSVLNAVRSSGARVLAKGDTDGHVVARAHPRATLEYAIYDRAGIRARTVSVAYWLGRVGPLHGREARELVRSIAATQTTVVETGPARRATELALAHAHAPQLADRLAVVPNPVAEPFTRGDVGGERERLLVAVGRWDLGQKNAPLLVAALERFLAEHRDHRAIVVGTGGDRVLQGRAGGRLERTGRLSHEEMAPLLRRARIVVSSSRWESFSLSSHEGLAMGCSVVGPDLAPLRDAVDQGPYGTLARGRDAQSLAAALAAEATAWEQGARDPVASAEFWRGRLDIDSVAARFAALLQPRGGSASARS